MFLRDLIFGWKSKAQPTRALVVLDDPVEAVAVPQGFAEPVVSALLAQPQGSHGASAGSETRAVGVLTLDKPITPRLPQEQARQRGLLIDGTLAAEVRREALIAELSKALSLRDVALVGTDRTARLLVANRRLLSARFSGPGRPCEFDLRRDPVDEATALELHAAIAALLAGPVDLMVDSRHASGVYAVDGGLPVDLLAVDADALRAAFLPPEVEEVELDDGLDAEMVRDRGVA